MAVIWCRHCGLPLTPDETSAGACPACGGLLQGELPPARPITKPVTKTHAGPGDSWWLLAGLIVLLTFALVAHPFLKETPAPKDLQETGRGPVASADKAAFRSSIANHNVPREELPSPFEEHRSVSDPVPRPPGKTTKITGSVPLIKFPQVFENGNQRTLDLPEGQYRASINNRTRVTLKGSSRL